MRRAAIIAVLLAATFGGACSDENDLTYFDASLSPQNEVPARASNASGVARMTFDGTTRKTRTLDSTKNIGAPVSAPSPLSRARRQAFLAFQTA